MWGHFHTARILPRGLLLASLGLSIACMTLCKLLRWVVRLGRHHSSTLFHVRAVYEDSRSSLECQSSRDLPCEL